MSCCAVGRRQDAADIDAALRDGLSVRKAAARFGVAHAAIQRHRPHVLADDEGDDTEPDTGATVGPDTDDTPEDTASPSVSPFAVPNPGDDPFTAPRKVITADIEERCVALRVKGKSYVVIAQDVGVTEETAIDAVERVLLRKRRGADAKADIVRKLELERLDRLIESLWDRATDPSMVTVDVPADTESGVRAYDGQDKAVDRVLKAMERRAKLEGLDVPTGPSTINVFAHPMFQNAALQIVSVYNRVLEAELPEALAARVLGALQEAGVVLGADGEKGLEIWLEERRMSAGALPTEAEVVE